jgi:L-rhamnose-H+ transport protein
MNSTAFGILLLVLAGAMNGSFTLPMKFTKKWAWENTWLVWSVFALVVFPPLLAVLTVPALGDVYSQAGAGPIAIAAGCGAGWGVAQVFFGLAVDAVGIALAFSVILGLSAAVGALIPLCLGSGPSAFSAKGLTIVAGVALVIVGVLVCAKAGRAREAALGQGPKGKPRISRGLLFCTLSGLGAAMVALGLQYGGSLARIAEQHGADPLWSNNATWLPLMLGGAIPNLIYCLYLISKNKTGNRFGTGGTAGYWFLAAIMALCWFGSTVMYGVSSNSLGIVVAWPAFMSLIVITAMIWGVVTGEWKGSGSKPLHWMYSGLAVLVLSIAVLSLAKAG